MTSKFNKFTKIMSLGDGFSDTDIRVHFWSMDMEERVITDFSHLCVLNRTKIALVADIRDEQDLDIMLNHLTEKFSQLNPVDYSAICQEEFDYQSKLAGFAARHNHSSKFYIVPIIELSGKDAESIISAIALIS